MEIIYILTLGIFQLRRVSGVGWGQSKLFLFFLKTDTSSNIFFKTRIYIRVFGITNVYNNNNNSKFVSWGLYTQNTVILDIVIRILVFRGLSSWHTGLCFGDYTYSATVSLQQIETQTHTKPHILTLKSSHTRHIRQVKLISILKCGCKFQNKSTNSTQFLFRHNNMSITFCRHTKTSNNSQYI